MFSPIAIPIRKLSFKPNLEWKLIADVPKGDFQAFTGHVTDLGIGKAKLAGFIIVQCRPGDFKSDYRLNTLEHWFPDRKSVSTLTLRVTSR